MIAITRWEFREPREALRVVSVAMEALHQLGVPNPARNFVVASQGLLNEDGIPVVVLAKKTGFTPDEEAAVNKHFAGYSELKSLYSPSQPGKNPFSDLILSNDPHGFARSYAYNVAPVDDNSPFFFFTLKLGQMLNEKGLHHGVDWKVNLGVMVLLLVLVISAARGFCISRSAARAATRPVATVRRSPFSTSWRLVSATFWLRSRSSNASCCFSVIPLTL